MNREARILSVGELYHPNRTRYEEFVEYNFWGNEHEMRFFLSSPTAREIEAIRRYPIHFGLFVRGDIIILVYKIVDYKSGRYIIDGDCPFSIHFVPPERNAIEMMIFPASEDSRVFLQVRLIDAATGIVRVLRGVSLSHQFSVALCSAIINQSKNQHPADYDRQLTIIHNAHPTTDSLLQHCIERCAGGD